MIIQSKKLRIGDAGHVTRGGRRVEIEEILLGDTQVAFLLRRKGRSATLYWVELLVEFFDRGWDRSTNDRNGLPRDYKTPEAALEALQQGITASLARVLGWLEITGGTLVAGPDDIIREMQRYQEGLCKVLGLTEGHMGLGLLHTLCEEALTGKPREPGVAPVICDRDGNPCYGEGPLGEYRKMAAEARRDLASPAGTFSSNPWNFLKRLAGVEDV